ncbi:MAG TPA: transposase, partial [Kineosporiaceae bacterium]|nr:transposase [Kineosporiaceae bacterium]
MRHPSFRFTVEDPSAELAGVLARHAGAARYAFNACLGLVKQAVAAHRDDPGAPVPYSRFDLINAWNHVKTSPAAGVDEHGNVGLPWRAEVCQQVFEEAAVDLGRGLAAYTASKKGARKGRRVGFPAFKRGRADESFRLRNKTSKTGRTSIRLGDAGPRTLNLPVIATLALVEETRRLRRMLDKGRAKILFATVRKTGRGRWTVSLNVEAADLHPDRQHPSPTPVVGVDRGLSHYAVAATATATGAELARLTAPKPLAGAQRRLRRANKALHRKKPGSANRGHPKAVVAQVHTRVCAVRSDYLHRVTTDLAKTHSLVAVETLN